MSQVLQDKVVKFINQYHITPQERFSQNFLVDDSALKQIIDDLPFEKADEVVEIGCGLGSLTSPLVEKAKHVTGVEFDRDMIKVLSSEIKAENFTLIQGDFLKQDLSVFHVKHTIYVGNLPYNISRDLIKKVAIEPNFIYFGFMVQQELAEKLVYKEESSFNNPYSVFLGLRGRVSTVCALHPGSFYPPPRVSSSFMRFVPTDNNEYAKEEVFGFIASCFKDPKKNLNNNLRTSAYVKLLAAMSELGVSPSLRPHELSLTQWGVLIKAALGL
jgi:16S rRNA (adenine1518-N6/adenine1519-N6)-dimethyltransferase